MNFYITRLKRFESKTAHTYINAPKTFDCTNAPKSFDSTNASKYYDVILYNHF